MSRIPVFDIGDTLVPSRRFVEHVIEDELRQRNHEPVHEFDPDKFMMYDPTEIEEYLRKYELTGDPEEIAHTCRHRYLDAFEDLLIENNVFDILARCNRKFGTIGIISDNTVRAKHLLEAKLDRHNVDYDKIVVSDEVGVEKPDPQIFNSFVEQRSESAEDFVYIGNDANRDAGALDAGMQFIWTTQFDTVNSSFEGPRINQLNFRQLKQVIQNLD
ncbi:MAG: HAD superfamily hydrolase (TIGR01549 family) [Candidatus Nanohaloarchaea archaeon]|jgi:HAD superfamily hydrolase (TIGR01549 family)